MISFSPEKTQAAISNLLLLLFVIASAPATFSQTGTSSQTPPPPPPPKPVQRPAPQTDPEAKRKAYLRYMEAHQLLSVRPARTTEAVAALKEVIQLDPTAADPHADLAEVYLFYLQRLDDAEREGLEAIRLDPDNLNGHKLLARLYVIALQYDKNPRQPVLDRAIREYEQVTRIEPGNAEAWAFLADLYQTKKNFEKRLQALERWAAAPASSDINFYGRLTGNDLSNARAYYQLSQIYLAQSKNAQAIEAASRAFDLEPESTDYVTNLIGMLRYSPSLADELRQYKQLTRVAESLPLQVGYSAALVRAGEYKDAAERLRKAVTQDPANATAVGLLSVSLRRTGRRVEAAEVLKQGIARVDDAPRTRLRLDLAETYNEMSRSDEAIAQYEQVFDQIIVRGNLEESEKHLLGEVMSKLTRLYSRIKNKTKPQALTTRAQKVLGEISPILDAIQIDLLRDEGRLQEALDLARTAARRFPEERSFKFTEAAILSETGNHQESAELLRGLLSEKPESASEDAGVYLLLSSVQMQNGMLREAESSVRKALQLTPDDEGLLLQLSSVQDKSGRHLDSEKTLRELLQRYPENATALNNLGYFLVERGERIEEAFKLIERAVNIEPLNGNFLDSLGWAHYKSGRLEQARVQLEKARQYAPRNAGIYEHLGDVLKDLGRVQEARRNWEKALELSNEAKEATRLKDKLKLSANRAAK